MSGMASQMLRNSKLESENVSLRASKASLRATNDNLLNDMLKDNLTLISYQDPAGSRDSSDEASCSCPCKTNHVKEAMARVLALSDTLQRLKGDLIAAQSVDKGLASQTKTSDEALRLKLELVDLKAEVASIRAENASLTAQNASLSMSLRAAANIASSNEESLRNHLASDKEEIIRALRSDNSYLKAEIASLKTGARKVGPDEKTIVDKSSWLPIKDYDTPWPHEVLGSVPPLSDASRPDWLPTKGLGQKTFISNPRKWSIKASDWIKLVEFFMTTDTWRALAAVKGEKRIATADVVDHFVKPLTKGSGSSLALLMSSDKDSIQNAQCMVSHTWKASMVETLRCFKEIDSSASCFFCAFSLYQNGDDHPDALTIGQQVELTPFAKIIESKPYYGMMVIHTSISDVYERLWVVHEADEARAADIAIRGLFDLDSFEAKDIKQLASTVNTRAAGVSVESDRILIEKRINEHGGYEELDERIRKLRTEMNSHLLPKAAKVGNKQMVKTLLQEQYDWNVKDNDGFTAMDYARRNDNQSIIAALVKASDGGKFALIEAAKKGELQKVEALILDGEDKAEVDPEYGFNPLIWAMIYHHEPVVAELSTGVDESLVSKSRDTAVVFLAADSAMRKYGEKPLVTAAEKGDREAVAAFLAILYRNIEEKDGRGWSTLLHAADKGWDSILNTLIQAGANVNVEDKEQKSPLLAACYMGYVDIAKSLINTGADLNSTDKFEYTSFDWACFNGHKSIVKLLHFSKEGEELDDLGVNAAITTGFTAATAKVLKKKYGDKPLATAAEKGDEGAVKVLLKNGYDNLEEKDGYEHTALVNATYNGYAPIVKALLQAGANKDAQSNNGNTALIVAAQWDHESIMQALLAAGANKDAQTNDGRTALILAALDCREGCVKLLMEAGADTSIKDKGGMTALDHASKDTIKAILCS